VGDSSISNQIPEKFFRGPGRPMARNVWDLRKLLEQLPDDLLINPDEGGGKLVVFNASTTPVLSIRAASEED